MLDADLAPSADTPTRSGDDDVYWLATGHRPPPAEALRRIRSICEHVPDLFGALMTLVSTHQSLRHDILATAVKQFRRDLDEFDRDEVAGLLRACWHGGWQGYDAVLRARRQRSRQSSGKSLGWMKNSDD